MTRSLRHISLLVAGVAGASAVASAQVGGSVAAPTLASAVSIQPHDLVGTWQYTWPSNPAARFETVRRILTFRPDSTWLHTLVWRSGADTTSCTHKMRWRQLSGGVLTWSPWFNLSWKQDDRVTLQDQQLSIRMYGEERFIRTAPVERAPRYIAPRPALPVTGTLAELLGTWKRVGGSAASEPGTIIVRRTFFPDSTIVETTLQKSDADTLVCTQEYEAWGARKQYGSGMPDSLTQYVVQGQRLSFFSKSSKSDTAHTTAIDIYERMSASQEP